MSKQPVWAVLVVAAGRGERAGLGLPKQYRPVAGISVLARSILALGEALPEAQILCATGPEDGPRYAAMLDELPPELARRLLPPVIGGPTRQASVRNGLESLSRLATPPTHVLIHDAARPFASASLVQRVAAAAAETGAAVPGVPVVDTIKRVDAAGAIIETPARSELRAVQTPQAFAFEPLLAAHRRAADAGVADLTDDAAVAEWAGSTVRVVEGDVRNVKLTRPEDFAEAEARLSRPLETRVGFGYDVHAFGPGDHVMLGGVAIPHSQGVTAHSDGDVALHAVTDAVLGALADGDIGSHFPPSDMQWKGASSDRFLAHAVDLVRARGGRIDHVDVTIVCEAPKVGPHRDAMRARIADICAIAPGRVAVKATTSERMGFTGRGEGIVAQAIATLRLPPEPEA
ncbi:bifunctional 2-C-methyl-D-erythritol 4-phosphate cytidylyltransferase/2-C-methyl-D-erythritol 2,4-cyclodiphosphate synthase [Alsobacter soli]|uniref:Bifunctional enzyme IspD/IspF n=1 Tax=Alsobacter soli TaxID=2109933 RepID=A0A2T1HXE0_9HYPH|nr:bifunctional 2-C-methyl-D-erythritol 4-phosphate cytidylyltransferase/2-C-methyl-D-erythritol 2,4-cyclodiphosphate synthase [Alsobacter soli]PSC06352.1 bifunctional 2-C-methyl-D-erythritol 4-phosphate cytidylyltransferase/2-C-methyl-D-erythritol 2,4-cyclodiphosphate synthase [Alsobacter soli]